MIFIRDIKKILSSKNVKICFLLYLIFYIFINYKMGKANYEDESTLLTSLFFISIKTVDYLNMFYFILPLVCGIVGSDIFAKDIRNGMIKNTVTRKRIKYEIRYRALLSFLVGGIFITSVFVLDIIIKAMLYPNLEPSLLGSYRMFSEYYYGNLWVNHSNLYILFAVFTTFCFSGLCSLTGYAVSLFTPIKIANNVSSFCIEFIKHNIIALFSLKQFTFLSIMSFVGVKMHGELYIMISSFIITLCIALVAICFKSENYEVLNQ